MLQRRCHNADRIVPESGYNGLEVMEVEDEEEDSVCDTPHHVDDNVEESAFGRRVDRAAKRRGRKISTCP